MAELKTRKTGASVEAFLGALAAAGLVFQWEPVSRLR